MFNGSEHGPGPLHLSAVKCCPGSLDAWKRVHQALCRLDGRSFCSGAFVPICHT